MSIGEGIAALWPIFIPQIPQYLVWLTGMVLALVFWRKHQRVSLLALLGFALLLIVSLVGTYLGSYLPISLRAQGMTTPQISRTIGFASLAVGLAAAAAWVLLVVALFIGRPRA